MESSNLSKLHPMAIGLLATKAQDKSLSPFVHTAYSMVSNRPSCLTDKWIGDINSWCEQILSGIEIGDSPTCSVGEKIMKRDLTVVKRRAKKWSGYPALITEDEHGWRYWMIWISAFEYSVGDKVNIEGVVREIKDGMVFLTRPSLVTRSKRKT